jgi:membrane-bound lytic murein transglycosylase B
MTKGLRYMQSHGAMLRKIETQFGVPGPVVVAIWGLETDFGTVLGKREVIRSAARYPAWI